MAKKTKPKSTATTASSWWAERSKILASLKPKSVRARPKPKKIKTKKVTKAKKVMKMKKVTKAKKGKKTKKA